MALQIRSCTSAVSMPSLREREARPLWVLLVTCAMPYPIEQPAALGVGHAGEISDRHGSRLYLRPDHRDVSEDALGGVEQQAIGRSRKSRFTRRRRVTR